MNITGTCFIDILYLQRSTVVGSSGAEISVRWLFLHSWQSHTWVSHFILKIFNASFLVIWLTVYMTTTLGEATLAPAWGSTLIATSLTASMTVNALVTGLIVFKILKVFSKVKPIYDQSLGSTRNTKRQVRQVIFIIIESGMALFAI